MSFDDVASLTEQHSSGGEKDPETARGGQNKGKRYHPEILTTKEVIALMGACSRRSPTGIRNRALIAVLWRAGLRLNETLKLYAKDIDRDKGSIHVLFGKGSKGSGYRARTVGIDPMALAVLELWVERRPRLPHIDPDRSRLFCSTTGKALWGSYVRALLPRLGRHAGIQKRVHPHGLRHTCAAQLAAEKTPVNLIQAQLGHNNIATTSRYLDHIAPEQLFDLARGRSWSEEVD